MLWLVFEINDRLASVSIATDFRAWASHLFISRMFIESIILYLDLIFMTKLRKVLSKNV